MRGRRGWRFRTRGPPGSRPLAKALPDQHARCVRLRPRTATSGGVVRLPAAGFLALPGSGMLLAPHLPRPLLLQLPPPFTCFCRPSFSILDFLDHAALLPFCGHFFDVLLSSKRLLQDLLRRRGPILRLVPPGLRRVQDGGRARAGRRLRRHAAVLPRLLLAPPGQQGLLRGLWIGLSNCAWNLMSVLESMEFTLPMKVRLASRHSFAYALLTL
mmetsp:Transcript_20761/g.58423  ORF Transcript_20761/g.58423 Transcript_20761/m.58423 type:complete len:214 (-) Transcript_20761:1013-1654(-)